jgi:peptidyl-dipeptidase A
MIRLTTSLAALAMALAVAPASAQTTPAPAAATLTPKDADAFVASAEAQLAPLSVDVNRISWVNATFITDDTDALAAQAGARQTVLQVQLATEAAKYAGVPGLSFDTARKIDLLRSGITLPAPSTPGAADELATIVTRMSSQYGKGRGTLDGKPINGSDIEAAMGTVRDPARLQEMWTSWHDNVGAQMRGDYARQVTIANQGAVELGYRDVGALWRAGYDMTPDQFAALTDKLWKQVEPLYLALHTYVRWKLNEKYGDKV